MILKDNNIYSNRIRLGLTQWIIRSLSALYPLIIRFKANKQCTKSEEIINKLSVEIKKMSYLQFYKFTIRLKDDLIPLFQNFVFSRYKYTQKADNNHEELH